jgi:hypothetical protein
MRKGGILTEDLHIFASVRSEAIYAREHRDLRSALDLAVHLKYDAELLTRLFLSRISLTNPSQFCHPELKTTDPVKALFGFTVYEHHDRRLPDGRPLSEDVLQAIIRHTRLVPRELMMLGKAVLDASNPARRTPRNVRQAVNAEAVRIVDYVISNCFPAWTTELDAALASLRQSIFDIEQFRRGFNAQLSPSTSNDHRALLRLLSVGLIGYSEPDPLRHRYAYLQKFVFDPRTHRARPDAEYFFVHPATKEWIRARSTEAKEWSGGTLLIGDGLPFESRRPIIQIVASDGKPAIIILGRLFPIILGETPDHLLFLFLSVLAWKRRGGNIWPPLSDLKTLNRSFFGTNSRYLNLSHADSARVRDWVKKINKLIKSLTNEHSRLTDRDHTLNQQASRRLTVSDRRRKGFISASLPGEEVASLSVGFPQLSADEIYVDEAIASTLRALQP